MKRAFMQESITIMCSSPEMDVNLVEGQGGEHAAPGKNLAPSPSSQRYLGPPLQFCISSEMDLIWSIPNVDEICRRIRAGGSATSMALGREYGISCGSSTATVRRTGWTRQLDGAALCAVSSSLQHLASHVSAWPQRSNLKQGPM